MPLVSISVVRGWSEEKLLAMNDGIHAALVEAFRIPEDDYNHRLTEFEPSRWTRPAGRSDKSVIVEMTVFPGRSLEAKRKLYREIVERLSPLGVPETEITIVLDEPPLTNWGIRGGKPASEAEIGFKLDV